MEILNIIILILGCGISYILGSISVARLITSRRKEGNIVNSGSGNPGTMNMLRNHGIVMGLFTLFCDALKGAIPALFGLLYFGEIDQKLAYIALFLFGLCAVLGHIFPIFYKFKGGKGIATTFGVFMVVDPITSSILFVILVVILYFTKIGSLVSLLFITIDGIVQMFKDYADDNWVMWLLLWTMVLLDYYAHKQNLVRLVDNAENPADLQASINKDINKLKARRTKKAKVELSTNEEESVVITTDKEKRSTKKTEDAKNSIKEGKVQK